MPNRNATRHLLLVVSVLLFIFVLVGYYLRTRADSVGLEPEIADAPQATPASSPPPPSAAPGASLRPAPEAAPSIDDDLAGWVPSVRGGEPGAADSGVITGLVPAVPGDGSSLSTRPPASAPEEGGALRLPAELVDGGDSPPPSGDGAFLASLPLSVGGSLSPPVSPAPPSGSIMPPPSGSIMPPPSGQIGSSLAPPPAAASSVSPASPGSGSTPAPAAAPAGGGLAPPLSPSPSSSPIPYDDDDDEDVILEEWEDDEPADAPPSPSAAAPAGSDRPQSPLPVPNRTAPPPSPDRAPSAPSPTNEGASDSLRMYVVRPGDSLSNIAARELGSSSLADNIFLLNRDVIDDPDHLLVGMKIRLPYANPAAPAANAPAEPPRRPTQGLGRTHIVAPGDTLSSIAMQYYGSSAGWRFLYESNKHLLPNPNQLSVGMEIAVPPYGK